MNGQEEHGVSYIEHKNPERSQFSFVLLVILSSLLLKKVHYLPTVPTYDYHHTVVVWWYLATYYVPTYEYLYTTLHLLLRKLFFDPISI